jgi:hypothetical protein
VGKSSHFIGLLCLGTALAGTPALAQASGQSSREAALEARLQQLEAAVAQLRGELVAARQTAAAAPQATVVPPATAAAPVVAAAMPAASAANTAAAKPADGFMMGTTQFKLSGYIRVNAIATRFNDGELPVGALGKEFYLPQQIPVGGGFASQDFLIQARQTRFVLNTATPVGNNTLKSHLEFDFAISTAPPGAQRATNAFVPNLRSAYLTYGGLLVGQEWSTFQNVSVLPESTDFVGPIEGTVFVRQAMVQYKVALGKNVDLLAALENPETEAVNNKSPLLSDNDDDRLPDAVLRLNARTGMGDFSLAGLVRELRVDNNGFGATRLGWGVSLAGKLPLGTRHDLRFMATYGDGIGRYLGLGFAPDVVFAGTPGSRLESVRNFAGFAALKLGWTDKLRSTFMAGYQDVDYRTSIVSPLTNAGAWSVAGNLFWTLAKNFSVGVEYRHAQRSLVNGDSGSMDRVESALKYSY